MITHKNKLVFAIATIMVASGCQANTETKTNGEKTAYNIKTADPQPVNLQPKDKMLNIHTGESKPISPNVTNELSKQLANKQTKKKVLSNAYPKFGTGLVDKINSTQNKQESIPVIVRYNKDIDAQQVKFLQSLFTKVTPQLENAWYGYATVDKLKGLANNTLVETIDLQPQVNTLPISDTTQSNTYQTPSTQTQRVNSPLLENFKLLAKIEQLKPNNNHVVSTYGLQQVTNSALLAVNNADSVAKPSWLDNSPVTLPDTYKSYSQLMYRQGMKLDLDFNKKYQQQIKGQISALDFSQAKQASGNANKQVNKLTQGLIKEFYTADNFERSDAIFGNLLHFKASWKNTFDKANTKKLPFTNVSGNQNNVATMIQEMQAYVAQYDGWQYVGLPFADGSMLQLFITPEKQLSALPNEQIATQLLNTSKKTKINLELPKLQLKGDTLSIDELTPELKQWQFTKLIANQVLKNPKLQQKVVVSWEEEGAEAAAASALSISKGLSMTPTVKVNQPFTFLIRYDGQVTFAGTVREIK